MPEIAKKSKSLNTDLKWIVSVSSLSAALTHGAILNNSGPMTICRAVKKMWSTHKHWARVKGERRPYYSQVLTRHYRVFISKEHPPCGGAKTIAGGVWGGGQKVNSEVSLHGNRAGEKVATNTTPSRESCDLFKVGGTVRKWHKRSSGLLLREWHKGGTMWQSANNKPIYSLLHPSIIISIHYYIYPLLHPFIITSIHLDLSVSSALGCLVV